VAWLIAWQLGCLIFAIGMPILGYLAITRQGIDLKGIIPLILCVLATLVGVIGFHSSLPSLRLYLFSTIPYSSHYLITADRLRRYSRRGKLLEDIPFSNVAEVRLVTRRLTEVFGEGADADVKARIVHIDLHNPEDAKTVVDCHFMRWSHQVHHTDLALIEDFTDLSIRTLGKKIKKRWQKWQEGPGRDAGHEQLRVAKRGPAPWYKRPSVIVSGVFGVIALGGLGCALTVALIFWAPRVAPIPNPNQQPIAEGPIRKPQQPPVEEANAKQPGPVQAAPEKLVPATLPGLIAYWPLNEGQGASTLDETRKQPAVLHGGEWVQGIQGAALRFNGTSDYVELGDDARLNFGRGAPFTLAGWTATEADRGPICTFRKANGFGVIGVLVVKGNLHGWVRDDNGGFGGVQLDGGSIKDGKWHHFALTRQPDGTVELFLDARSQGKNVGKNTGGPITTDLRALASDRFVVASGKNATAYLAGTINEVCLYDRVLAPAELGVLARKKE
jgi:Concanavalin A-like lectin/glucanases superfamily